MQVEPNRTDTHLHSEKITSCALNRFLPSGASCAQNRINPCAPNEVSCSAHVLLFICAGRLFAIIRRRLSMHGRPSSVVTRRGLCRSSSVSLGPSSRILLVHWLSASSPPRPLRSNCHPSRCRPLSYALAPAMVTVTNPPDLTQPSTITVHM